MIIDFHTHIFPPDVRDRRDDYIRRDPTFAEMYANPKAKVATAEDLLASMDESGVDISVAVGFAWQDYEDNVRHNDYLMEWAHKSDHVRAFPCINMANVWAVDDGDNHVWSRGVGELRPESQGWDLGGPKGVLLADVARRLNLALLFHVTEPGDRSYPGRRGLALDSFRAFSEKHPELTVIGAHLGGGFYATTPSTATPFVDSAAQPFLYPGEQAIAAFNCVPTDRLLFGSDFPLISQARQIAELRTAIHDEARLQAALGGNARRLLGIE